MQYPECKSTHIRKNGHNKGKQNHICVTSGRQFIDDYNIHRGYSDETKRESLTRYVNGSGFRQIDRVKAVHHTTVITLARLHRKTLCYSKSIEMLGYSIRLLIHYLKFWEVPIPA